MKSLSHMTPKEIVEGVRNGNIDSMSFASFKEYLDVSTKLESYKKDRDNFAGYLFDSQKECEQLEQENKRLKEKIESMIESLNMYPYAEVESYTVIKELRQVLDSQSSRDVNE